MNLEEYNRWLFNIGERFSRKAANDIVIKSSVELLATIKNRIQREGKNTAGAKMKKYSTKPMYASKGQFVKKSAFKARGKRGFVGERVYRVRNPKVKRQKREDWVFKVRKVKPKTMFLEHGYKELREVQGRTTEVRNYTYTGSLMASYKMVNEENVCLLGIDDKKSAKIKGHLENKDGKSFTGSKKELNTYKKNVAKEISELYTKALTEFNG